MEMCTFNVENTVCFILFYVHVCRYCTSCVVVVVVDFYFASQGQTGNGAQFYGSEFQKGESYGEREREKERERERERERGGGGREGGR